MSQDFTTVAVGDRSMPTVGMGLWKVEHAADAVYQAIKIGYRHLDCASDYANEQAVGQGIQRALKEGLCTREDLWVTSKLWNTDHRAEHVQPALEKTLMDLQLDYLDLYLIHFPISLAHVPHQTRYPAEWIFDPDAAEPKMVIDSVPLSQTWASMEELVEKNRVRAIGVCNYNTGLMQDLLAYAKIKPAVLQIESHPFLTQEKLIRLCHENGIVVTAFSPLGSLSYVELDMASSADSLLQNQQVERAAKRVGRTAAQIVLRWGVQRGLSIIPKSSNPQRQKENLSLFDFELTEEEMTTISSLNQNRRFNDPGVFCELAFGTFCPIYD